MQSHVPSAEPGSDPVESLELQPAPNTGLRAFPDQGKCGLDLSQEGVRDPCIIRRFTIMGWQEAYLYVILSSFQEMRWCEPLPWRPLDESSFPVLGVLLLAGQDTEEPQCVAELHCPSSSTSSQPLPTIKTVLRAWRICSVHSWGCLWCRGDASDISAFLRLFFSWINFHFAKVASSCEALDRRGWR